MSDVSTEQRLQLVQQIRSRYQEDKYDMHCREHILYGRQSSPADDLEYLQTRENEGYSGFSFKSRMLVAILLFLGLVIINENQIKIAGITSNKIIEMISADYEAEIDSWVEALSK
ncbi:MAG: hypothetical protein ACI4HQ_07750 [Acetatifactor sp.]